MSETTPFIFCSCQYGAQTALKKEFATTWPQFKLSFSRPGFVTFKVPEEFPAKSLPTLDLKSTFTRSSGISLGSVKASEQNERIQLTKKIVENTAPGNLTHLHLWRRDRSVPGERGFEPGREPETDLLAKQVASVPVSYTHLTLPTILLV